MIKSHLNILRCPRTKSKLSLEILEEVKGRIKEGKLISENKVYTYPITNFIPRFVPPSNYADNFGLQWNKFSKTQVDSFTKKTITFDRFWKATGWNSKKMESKYVLDVGCGSGRFAEICLQTNAIVIAIDFSSAVDAAYKNFGENENLFLIQADIYDLPFAENTFPYIYSLGVLQHTPDVKKSFDSIVKLLQPGGYICVDYYWKRLISVIHPKYVLRPLTKRMNKDKLFSIVKKILPGLLKVSNFLISIPIFGKFLSRFIPVANYKGTYDLSAAEQFEWSLLDTYDWFSPAYDNPQTISTVRRWCKDNDLVDIEIFHGGHLVARGKKPNLKVSLS